RSGVPARGEFAEQVDELTLLLRHDRADHLVASAGLQRHELVGDLLHRLARDTLAAHGTVGDADSRPQQTHVVVNLRDRADRRSRVAVGGLLVDRHGRAETLDEVDVWPVDLAKELASIGGEGLDVATLALREN